MALGRGQQVRDGGDESAVVAERRRCARPAHVLRHPREDDRCHCGRDRQRTFIVRIFVLSYLAQLHYGISGFKGQARWWHSFAYISLTAALVGFVGGIWFA